MSRLEVAERNVADFYAYEAQSGKSDRSSHMAHLTILALGEREADPAGGDVCAEPDGWGAWPEVFGFLGDFGYAGLGMVPLDVDPCGEFFYGIFGDLAVNLGKVCARVTEFWVEQFFDERSVVRKEQGSFAVVVEAPGCVDASWKAELVKRLVPCFWRELAEYTERLVEKNDRRHRAKYSMKAQDVARAFLC